MTGFYVIEATIHRGFLDPVGPADQGWLAQPNLALCEVEAGVATSSLLRASDSGYRTLATDLGGVIPYPPTITDTFQVDVAANLDPTQSAVAAAWGTLSLANMDHAYDTTLAGWQTDGQPITIYRGEKTIEDFPGPRSNRSTAGTYLGSDGLLHSAAAGVVRYDWSSGAPVALNELAANNYLTSSMPDPSSANVTTTRSTDVTTLLTGTPVFKSVRTVTGTDSNTVAAWVTGGLPTTGVALRGSVWMWIPSALTGKTSVGLGIEGNVSGGSGSNADLTKRDQWQRVSAWANLGVGSSSTFLVLRVNPQVSGDIIYTTGWQMELDGGAATSFIPLAPTQAFRDADRLCAARNILLDPSHGSLTRVFAGVMGPWRALVNLISIDLHDASSYLQRQFPRTLYGGTGGYDGTAALVGVAKPLVIGGDYTPVNAPLRNITPQALDPANLIYQCNDGLCFFYGAYDGGAALTYDGPVNSLYGTAVAAGHYASDFARGLIKLGSAPVFTLTVDAAYTPSGGNTVGVQALAVLSNPYQLAVPVGMLGGYGTTAMQVYGVDGAVATAAMAVRVGLFIAPTDMVDGITFMDRLLAPSGALLVPGRDGSLRLLVLAAIPSGSTPVVSFDDSTIVSIEPQVLPATIDPPPWRMRLAYGRNWTVQSGNLAGSITAAQLALVTTDNRVATAIAAQTVGQQNARPTDPAVIGAQGGSVDLTAAPAQSVVNNMLKLFGIKRRLYDITVPASVGLALDWASIVSVTSDFDGLQSPGKLGQVVGWRYSTADATAMFRVLV